MDPPRAFRLPLDPAVLDDPAFSPDPRSHPHFPLADAYSTPSPPTTVLKPVSTNTPRRARVKAFVRRLTTRHHLDRIDELDETDPFGANFHHDGPYEAIVSDVRRSKRESDPHPLRPRHHQSTHRLPPPYGETGFSLHLEPGQILQSSTIYSSYATSIAPASAPFLPRLNTISIVTKPGPPLQSRQSSPPPWACHPNWPPDHDAPPYVRHQTPKAVPPPRYGSTLYPSDPPRSPQRTPPSPVSPASPQTRSTESVVLPSRHDSRHKVVHSLDSSRPMRNTFTRSFSKSLDPPRMHHLPKRLVMPAPLQAQQHHKPFPAEPPSWQDEYPDDLALDDAHFHMKPQESRLLRKRSAFPASTPIPDHVSVSQDDTVSIIGNPSTKMVNEAGGTKERARRRLSKRKNDI